ncbi:hypothetical protein D3C77_312920 [compost metagenome]
MPATEARLPCSSAMISSAERSRSFQGLSMTPAQPLFSEAPTPATIYTVPVSGIASKVVSTRLACASRNSRLLACGAFMSTTISPWSSAGASSDCRPLNSTGRLAMAPRPITSARRTSLSTLPSTLS